MSGKEPANTLPTRGLFGSQNTFDLWNSKKRDFFISSVGRVFLQSGMNESIGYPKIGGILPVPIVLRKIQKGVLGIEPALRPMTALLITPFFWNDRNRLVLGTVPGSAKHGFDRLQHDLGAIEAFVAHRDHQIRLLQHHRDPL